MGSTALIIALFLGFTVAYLLSGWFAAYLVPRRRIWPAMLVAYLLVVGPWCASVFTFGGELATWLADPRMAALDAAWGSCSDYLGMHVRCDTHGPDDPHYWVYYVHSFVDQDGKSFSLDEPAFELRLLHLVVVGVLGAPLGLIGWTSWLAWPRVPIAAGAMQFILRRGRRNASEAVRADADRTEPRGTG